jgi:hypothetical protein
MKDVSSRKRVRIYSPTSRGAPPLAGRPGMVVGLICGSVGFFLLLIAFEFIKVPERSFRSGRIPFAAFAVLMASLGTYLVVLGILERRRAARLRDARVRMPAEPWEWDYAWDRYGSRDTSLSALVSAVVSLALIALFALMFNTVLLDGRSPIRFIPTFPFVEMPNSVPGWYGLVPLIFILFLNLLLIWLVWNLAHKTAHVLKYRGARVRYDSFPYFIGSPMQLTLVLPPKEFQSVKAELRCIEQVLVADRGDDEYGESYETFRVYAAEQQLQPSQQAVRFDLPADLPGTLFSERPYRYWELVVKAAAPGLDYVSEFLIPIYRRDSPVRPV